MSKIHTVVQGEYLVKIAALYGLADYSVLWNHPRNAALKQKRGNPNVLLPGDPVFIPDKQAKEDGRGTDKAHVFQVKRPRVLLRVILEDIYELPIAGAPCLLRLKSQTIRLVTRATGKLEQEIAVTDDVAQLIVQDPQTPVAGAELTFRIGDLDPQDQVSGQKARLANLGYYIGSAPKETDEDDRRFRSAVEEFQCDHPPLKVNGICDVQTQAQLKAAHGC